MKKEKIFIVEDDKMIVQLLTQHLSKRYDVLSVKNFKEVSKEIQYVNPDIVLMDISLPYYNGFYWTTEIRKNMTLPIIFISSSDDEMNAVMAMNMGGDDFIAKPFSLTLLDAKLSAFLRRANQFSKSINLSFDGYQLTEEGQFGDEEKTIQLTPTETKILKELLRYQEQIVEKNYLLEQLWDNDEFIDQNTLNVNMTRLRKKVGEIGFDKIHTVRGVGYLIK